MIYFDTAYIAKCYLKEPDSDRVRTAAGQATGLACCELGRVEFASLLRRRLLMGYIDAGEQRQYASWFERDEKAGIWRWLPLNAALVEAARSALLSLPANTPLRAGDALHLACARMHGFTEIYSNDRHLLAAAPHFQLRGVNLLDEA